MATMEPSEPQSEKGLKTIKVLVKFKTGGESPTFAVKIKQTESLRKIKKHITESLDIQGKLMYKGQNCEETSKRLSDYSLQEEMTFILTAERKKKDLKHKIKLQIPEEVFIKNSIQIGDGMETSTIDEEDGTIEVKVARTTTIINLKHKLQDILGIPVEEQSLHVSSQGKE